LQRSARDLARGFAVALDRADAGKAGCATTTMAARYLVATVDESHFQQIRNPVQI
jgi:hypothetical protein